jgi:hypothetical protein
MNLIPVTVNFIKSGKKLSFKTDDDKLIYDTFVQKLPENENVSMTLETQSDSGSYAQLSKIHKCIRELAVFTGSTFEEMKDIVKMHSGLVFSDTVISFSSCSKEELDLVIKSIYEIGEKVSFPLP